MKIYNYLIILLFITNKSLSQNNQLKKTGDYLRIILPVSALSTSFILNDKNGKKQFAKSFIATQLITFGLKTVIHKPRPDLSNNNSFPSGHTSTVFQSAAFIQKRYGWEYGIPAYVLAGVTGYSRINAKKHDYWDVFAGAVIGISSSYLFTTNRDYKKINLTYNANKNGGTLNFRYTF